MTNHDTVSDDTIRNDTVRQHLEERAYHYEQDLFQEHVSQIKIESAEHTANRYAPWLQKSLEKMRHSKQTWNRVKHEEGQKKRQAQAQAQASIQCASIWVAAQAGNVAEVERFLMLSPEAEEGVLTIAKDKDHKTRKQVLSNKKAGHKKNLLSPDSKGAAIVKSTTGIVKSTRSPHILMHHDDRASRGTGETLLHIACWHGHLPLVKFILHLSTQQSNTREVVNALDTAQNQSSPLIQACRNHQQGLLNDRLEIIKLLIQHGANVEHQDSHGDNALHWAARRRALPLVRYLLKSTDASVFATIADNAKRQKPLDIAQSHLRNTPNNMATIECFTLLQQSLKGCNMRLRIQQQKKVRQASTEERVAGLKLDELELKREALNFMTSTDEFYHECHARAEASRLELERAKVSEVETQVRRETLEYLKKNKDGRKWVKDHLSKAVDDVRERVKAGTLARPKDVKKYALAELKEGYVEARVREQAQVAREAFQRHNPTLENVNDWKALQEQLASM